MTPEAYNIRWNAFEKARKRCQKDFIVAMERFETRQKDLYCYNEDLRHYFFRIGVSVYFIFFHKNKGD